MSTSEHTWKSAQHRTPVGVRQWRVSESDNLPPNALVLHPAYRTLVAFGTLGLLAVVCWLLLLLIQGPPTSHVVMIGITEYRNGLVPLNDFGRQDMERLERGLGTVNRVLGHRQFSVRATQARGSGAADAGTTTGSDNNLNSESYSRVFQDLKSLSGIGRSNVLVFCSLHARVDPAGEGTCRLMFLNADGRSSTGEVKLADFLTELVQLPAGHVFLFIDASRLTGDWGMGVLCNQFSSCLQSEVAQLDTAKLTVICAADSGQRSWTDETAGMSVFFRSTLRALSGDADGWAGGPRDNVVDSHEVFGFVANQVEDWVRNQRGQSQTVVRLGSAANIALAVHVGGQQALEAAAAEQAARDKPDEDKPDQEQAAGEPAAAEQEPAKTQQNSQVAQAASADGGTTPAAGSQSSEVNSASQSDKPSEEDSSRAGSSRAQAASRLHAAWKLRDLWRQDGHLALIDPALWQYMQSELIRCQELLRHGEYAAVVDRVQQLEGRVAQVGALGDGRLTTRVARQLPTGLPSLIRPPAAVDGAAVDQGPEEVKRRELLIARVEEYLQAPEDQLPELVGLRRQLREQPEALEQLIVEIEVRAQQPGNCRQPAVNRLRALIDLIPQTHRNATLMFVSRFADLKGDDLDKRDANCRGVLSRRLQVDRLLFDLLQQPQAARYVQAEFVGAVRELNAAQRWLLLTDGRVPKVSDPDGRSDHDFVDLHLERCGQQIAATRLVFDRIGDALRLRAQILSELPALAVWKAQVFEADAGRGFPEPDQQRPGLLVVWKAAMDHIVAMEALLRSGRMSSAEVVRQIAKENGELRFLFDETRKVWQNELSELESMELQADDWQRVDRALRSPWMTADTRQALVAIRDTRTVITSGVDRATLDQQDARPNAPGIWQGWWAIQMLKTNGRDTGKLERNFQSWKKQAATAGDGSSRQEIAVRRSAARVGADVCREFRDVARDVTAEQRDPAVLRQLYIAGLTEDRLSRARGTASAAEGPLRLLEAVYAGVRGDLDSEQRPDAIRGYQQRFQRMLMEIAGNARDFRDWNDDPEPQLQGDLKLDETQRVVDLQLNMDVPDGQAERPVRTLALCQIATLERRGGLPAAGRETVLQQVSGTYHVDYKVDEMVDVPQAELTVAVVDPQTGFPLAIWSDNLQRPSEPNKWRVVFRAENDPDDSRNRIKPRQTVVTLPVSAAEQPHALRAYLLKPAADSSVDKVGLTLWTIDGDGGRRLLAENVQLDVSGAAGQPHLISWQPSAPQPAAQPPAGNTPQPAATTRSTDLSNGLVLLIKPLEPLSKPAFEYVVLFDLLRPIEHLKQDPELTFTDDQLTVTVERRSPATADVLLPEEIPVQLRLPTRVDRQKDDNSLLQQTLTAENPAKTVYAGFAVDTLDALQQRSFEVLLDVGGIPHSFRWNGVQPGSTGELQRGDDLWMEIQEPVDSAIFSGKDAVPLQVKLDGSELRVPITGNSQKPWKLRYRLTPEAARNDPRKSLTGETFIVRRPRRSAFRLQGIAQGVWQIAVEVGDFVWPNVRPPQPGTFVVELTLQRGSRKLSRETQFVVDTSPPVTQPIGRIPENVNVRDQTLDLRLKAEDLQSGIQEVIAVFDLDDDRKIGEDERRGAVRNRNLWSFKPLESGKDRPLQPLIKVPLPTQADKTYRLLVQATNGAGVLSKMIYGDVDLLPARVLVEVRTNIAPNDRYRWTVLDADGKPCQHAPPRVNQRSPQTFKLPVGKYTFKVDGRRVGSLAVALTDKDWQERPLSSVPDKRIVIPVTIK